MNKPWMPFYIADFVADTLHLDAAATGAYMLLLCHYWRKEELPGSPIELARIARLSAHKWKIICPTLQAFFYDGWKHKRMEEELERAYEISGKRRDAANKRHQNGHADVSANVVQMHAQSQSQAQIKTKPSLRSGTHAPVSPRGARLPEGWTPNEADYAFALSVLGNASAVSQQMDRFHDYYRAQAGQKGVKADWGAAWRNWCRRSREVQHGGRSARGSKSYEELALQLGADGDA